MWSREQPGTWHTPHRTQLPKRSLLARLAMVGTCGSLGDHLPSSLLMCQVLVTVGASRTRPGEQICLSDGHQVPAQR